LKIKWNWFNFKKFKISKNLKIVLLKIIKFLFPSSLLISSSSSSSFWDENALNLMFQCNLIFCHMLFLPFFFSSLIIFTPAVSSPMKFLSALLPVTYFSFFWDENALNLMFQRNLIFYHMLFLPFFFSFLIIFTPVVSSLMKIPFTFLPVAYFSFFWDENALNLRSPHNLDVSSMFFLCFLFSSLIIFSLSVSSPM